MPSWLRAARGQALDGPRLVGIVGVGAERGDAGEHAVADAGGGTLVLLALAP